MANVLVQEQYLQDIADSIRAKNGTSNTYKPAQMSTAIDNIPTGGQPIVIPDMGIDHIEVQFNGSFWQYFQLPQVTGLNWNNCLALNTGIEKYDTDLDKWVEVSSGFNLDSELSLIDNQFGILLDIWDNTLLDSQIRIKFIFLFNTGVYTLNTVPVQITIPETCTIDVFFYDINHNNIRNIITNNNVTIKNSDNEDVPFIIHNDYYTDAIEIHSKDYITITITMNGSQVFTQDYDLAQLYEDQVYVTSYDVTLPIKCITVNIDNNGSYVQSGYGLLNFYDANDNIVATYTFNPTDNFAMYTCVAERYNFTFTSALTEPFSDSGSDNTTIYLNNIIVNTVPEGKMLIDCNIFSKDTTDRNKLKPVVLSDLDTVSLYIWDDAGEEFVLLQTDLYGLTISAFIDRPLGEEPINLKLVIQDTNYSNFNVQFTASTNNDHYLQIFTLTPKVFEPSGHFAQNELKSLYNLDTTQDQIDLFHGAQIVADQSGINHIYLNYNSINDRQAIQPIYPVNTGTLEIEVALTELTADDYIFGVNSTNFNVPCYTYYNQTDNCLCLRCGNNDIKLLNYDSTFLAQKHLYHLALQMHDEPYVGLYTEVGLYIDGQCATFISSGFIYGNFNINTNDLIGWSHNKMDITSLKTYPWCFSDKDVLAHYQDYTNNTSIFQTVYKSVDTTVLSVHLSYTIGIDSETGLEVRDMFLYIRNSSDAPLPMGTTLTITTTDLEDNIVLQDLDITPAIWSEQPFEFEDVQYAHLPLTELQQDVVKTYELTFTLPE